MRIHEILTKSKKHSKPRRGRGIGSSRGAKSGRGQKGQRSRSGGRLRRGFEGGRTPLMRLVPKKRGVGYKNPRSRQTRFYAESVTLAQIDRKYKAGELVSPKSLARHNLIKVARGGAKIIAKGELKKKFRFRNFIMSKKAEEEIKKSGSTIEAVPKKTETPKDISKKENQSKKN